LAEFIGTYKNPVSLTPINRPAAFFSSSQAVSAVSPFLPYVAVGTVIAAVAALAWYLFPTKTMTEDQLNLNTPGQNYSKVIASKKKYQKKRNVVHGQNYTKVIAPKKKFKRNAQGQHFPEKMIKAPKRKYESSSAGRIMHSHGGIIISTDQVYLACQTEKTGSLLLKNNTTVDEYVLHGTNCNLVMKTSQFAEGFYVNKLRDVDFDKKAWWNVDESVDLFPYEDSWIMIRDGEAYVMSHCARGQMGTFTDHARHKVRSVANNIFEYELVSIEGRRGQGFCFSPGGRHFVMNRHSWEFVNEGCSKVAEFLIRYADCGKVLRFARSEFTVRFPEDKRDCVFIEVLNRSLPALPSLKKRLRISGHTENAPKVARVVRFLGTDKSSVEYGSMVFDNRVKRNEKYLNIDYCYVSEPSKSVQLRTETFMELPGALGVSGDCGSVYVIFDSRTGIADIVGIHSATYQGSAIIVPVYQSDFPKLGGETLDYTHYGEIETIDVAEGQCVKESYPVIPGTRQLGVTLRKQAYVPTTTIFQKSVIFDELEEFLQEEIPVCPANLQPEVHHGSFVKLAENSGIEPLDPEIARMIEEHYDEIIEGWLPVGSDREFVELSLKKALFSDNVRGLESMDPTKSATYENFVAGLKRENLYGRSNAPKASWIVSKKGWWINPALVVQVGVLLKHIENGGQVKCLATACWKDELRSLQNYLDKKTRLFCVGSFSLACVTKMIFGDLVKTKDDLTIRPGKVGINPYSMEWNVIYACLRRHPNLFGGDCKGWDYRVRALFLFLFKKFINTLKITDIHRKRMLALSDTVMGMVMVYRSWLVERLNGVPSGHWLTSYFNTFANFCAHKITWMYCRPDSTWSWDDHVFMMFYGDDNGGSVSNEASVFFNMQSIQKVFRMLDLEYTTPDKKDVTEKFLNWDDYTFLSRSFVEDPLTGRVHAPLNMDSIIGMLAWVRKPGFDRTPLEQLGINMEVATRELSLYPRETAEKWYAFFKVQSRRYGIPYLCKTFEEVRRDVEN
jgi:hypothetical protein